MNHGLAVVLFILTGVSIRTELFLSRPSLYNDEALLAWNIIDRTGTQLLQRLDYEVIAPPFFLLAVKYAAGKFNYADWALRLLPFTAGIISIFMFSLLSDKLNSKKAALLAIGLFSWSDFIISYSYICKQYMFDLLSCIIVLYLALKVHSGAFTYLKHIVFGAFCSVLVWFSHPVIFIIAGVSAALLYESIFIRDKARRDWIKVAAGIVIWVTAFLLEYNLFVKLTTSAPLYESWDDAFAPFPFTSFPALFWYPKAFSNFTNNVLGLCCQGIVFMALLVGINEYLKQKKFFVFQTAVFPALLLWLFSMSRHYPVGSPTIGYRLIIFMLPMTYIIMSEGISRIFELTSQYSRPIAFCLIGIIFSYPLVNNIKRLSAPERRMRCDAKPAIEYYINNRLPEDIVYVNLAGEYIFRFYTIGSSIIHFTGSAKKDDYGAYLKDIAKLPANGRTWYILLNISREGASLFSSCIESTGKIIKRLDRHNAYAILAEK